MEAMKRGRGKEGGRVCTLSCLSFIVRINCVCWSFFSLLLLLILHQWLRLSCRCIHVIRIVMQRIVVHSTVSCYARGFQCTRLCVCLFPCVVSQCVSLRARGCVCVCVCACVRACVCASAFQSLYIYCSLQEYINVEYFCKCLQHSPIATNGRLIEV